MEKFPTIDALLEDDEMDELFRVAFKNMKKCRKTVDRMRPGAVISTPTPTAENNARGLVHQGNGSCEVRVPWGLDSPGLPLYIIITATPYGYPRSKTHLRRLHTEYTLTLDRNNACKCYHDDTTPPYG